MKSISSNAPNLFQAIQYLKEVIQFRLELHFNSDVPDNGIKKEIPSPAFFEDDSEFAQFISKMQFTFEEYIIFLIALAPEIYPGFYESILQQYMKDPANNFLAFGGVKGKSYRGIIPTLETAYFILSGGDIEKRLMISKAFEKESALISNFVIDIIEQEKGDPFPSAKLKLSEETISLILKGRPYQPDFNKDFPAKRINTSLRWDDMVLSPSTAHQINDIKIWLQCNATLMENGDMKRKIKPGYRVLFYGPPGTGKTMAASLLGKEFQRPVYRIDLSQVVSKYIGETEKNLEKIFKVAQNRNWILFFDEADALFGKRTKVNDAQDRFANQEVSYLLQRIEDFEELIILASNNKQNIDEAFSRRFNSIIKFPFPKKKERIEIWQKAFPADFEFEDQNDFTSLLGDYELSGGNIINVVHYSCLNSVKERSNVIRLQHVLDGIEKELNKEGKAFVDFIKWV
ncbi:MAG: ATP-binding protein [Bacteroidetes bacterium]|nr:MAG: ATP-binding protein [Bacteroidota bacterium]